MVIEVSKKAFISIMSTIGTVEKSATKKAVKKTTKAPATKKAKSAAAHPPYFQMIKEALLALSEKGGSSPHAIAKYMEEKHKSVLPDNFRKKLALQLKNSASKGKLTKVKASYKLSDAAKKDKPAAGPAVKKAKKPAARASADVAATVKKGVKKPVVKKSVAKKAPVKAKKAKAKQPKSIKSPAAKKARKAAA